MPLLPLPKRSKLRFVVVVLYALPFYCAFDLCWNRLFHGHWQLQWGRLISFAVGAAFTAIVDLGDYYGWRNRFRQPVTLNPDREEGPASL